MYGDKREYFDFGSLKNQLKADCLFRANWSFSLAELNAKEGDEKQAIHTVVLKIGK